MYPGIQLSNRPKRPRRSLLDIIRWGCGRRSRFLVQGNSMNPTLFNGVSVLYYSKTVIHVEDIILFHHPHKSALVLIKRCIKREENQFWAEGDNPRESNDSRHFGWVPQNCYIGTVTSIL